MRPAWFGRIFERRLAKEFAGAGWLSVAGYHVAPPHGDLEQPRVWLTLASDEHPRCVDGWSFLADDDFLAVAALLALPRARWYNEETRALATSPRAPEPSRAAAARDLVAHFEASWTPGAGGWIRMRMRRGAGYAARFEVAEASRFAACLATSSAREVVFDPGARSIRALPDGVTIARLVPWPA